jgi:hypothetical protein
MLLFLSLIFNGFQFYQYSNEQDERILIEKSLLMNEFSDRAEKWRNFNQFVIQILHKDNINYPINKQRSDIYYELAKHEMSVIQKQTNNVSGFAITPNYSDYAQFISEFDIIFEGLVQRFNSKLPLMEREQLVKLSNKLEESYKLYMNDAVGEFGSGTNGSVMVSVTFEPDVKTLDKVIDELLSIRKSLEVIE